MTKPRQDALDLAQRTMDTKTFPAYGGTSWAQCAELLLRKTFSTAQVEVILRSAIMDRATRENDGVPTSAGLRRFMHRYAINPYNLPERLAGMVAAEQPDPRLEAVRPAARRILNLMFLGGVTEQTAANMEALNTQEWQRALAYARAALEVPE